MAPAGRSGGECVSGAIRIGVDVGGTFTKAVAVETAPLRLLAHAAVPTSHEAAGVAEGVAAALRNLLEELGDDRRRVALVAFSTTQAMNALLEGDVGRVGVLGIGSQPDLRAARKRTRVGSVALAPGHSLETEHAFIDVTGGIDETRVDAALEILAAAGCASIAVSGALAVDEPCDELLVARCAQARGLPACVGHDLTGAYGLEMRTVSAAVNASILPVVQQTASLVEQALEDAGLDVPLLVLRGDGGAMSVDAFRRRPCFTIGSGPAAGVAAALHQLEAHGRDRRRVRRHELQRVGRQAWPACRPLAQSHGSSHLRARGGQLGRGRSRREHGAPQAPLGRSDRAPQRPHRRSPLCVLRRPVRARGRPARARLPARRRSGGVCLRQGRRQALRADCNLRRQRARARRPDRVLVCGHGGGAGSVRAACHAPEDDAARAPRGSCWTVPWRRSSRRLRMPHASTTLGLTCHSLRWEAPARRSCHSSPSG